MPFMLKLMKGNKHCPLKKNKEELKGFILKAPIEAKKIPKKPILDVVWCVFKH